MAMATSSGTAADFEIWGLDASRSGNTLTVTITTNFASKGGVLFDGIGDANLTGGTGNRLR